MNTNRLKLLAAGTVLGFVAACHPAAAPPPAAPGVKPETDVTASVVHRVKDLDDLIFRLKLNAGKLPANSDGEQRGLMGDAFSDISAILPLLQGSERTGGFDQELQLIGEARSRLAALPGDVSAEPVIAGGLRNTFNALSFISSDQFSDRTDISKNLAALGEGLNELDVNHGATAWEVQANSVRLIGNIVDRMHAVLVQRMGTPPPAKPARASTRH